MENDNFVAPTQPKDAQVNDTLFSFEKPLRDITQNDILQNIAEKTKKIQSAIYMVAKFIPVEDPMHYGVKKTSTDLFDLLFVKDIIDPLSCGKIFMQSVVYVDKLIAQIETASLVGYITMMNRAVLVQTLVDMRTTVTQYALHTMQSESAPYVPDHVAYFSLPKVLLETKPAKVNSVPPAAPQKPLQSVSQNDMSLPKTPTRNPEAAPIQKDIQSVKNPTMSFNVSVARPASDRQQSILSLMQKKHSINITDIVSEIKGVSEKTIQRDLMDLIQKGQIVREGNKRWSTYRIVRIA